MTNMFVLGFLLVSMAYAAPSQPVNKNDFVVQINDHTLKSVEKTAESSSILDLSDRDINTIEANAFPELSNVESVNLSNNKLETLSPSTFANLNNLKHILLSNNALKKFKSAFKGLSKLETLDITNNSVRYLYSNYFEGLGCSADIQVTPKSIRSIVADVFNAPEEKDPKLTDQPDVLSGHTEDESLLTENLDHPTLSDSLRVKLCSNEGAVTSLEVLNNDKDLSENCKEVEVDHANRKISLSGKGISTFANGWYRLQDFSVKSVDLSSNKIVDVTSELLNGLPESVTDVSLSENKIESLKAGIINNKNLRSLNFWKNVISEIEADAFKDTRLTGLHLIGNKLRNTQFAATLPSTLTVLGLGKNEIEEVTANSFASLGKLQYVNLSENKIKKIGSECLRGLSSLESLDLDKNQLETIEVGSFKDLKTLTKLTLDDNKLTGFNKGVFDGLSSINRISITFNKLTTFKDGALHGLPETLQDLHLDNNEIESLEKEMFNDGPKGILSLRENKIKRIELGSLNLPRLEVLQLDNNQLEVLETGVFEILGKLKTLSLRGNKINKIEKGAAKGLVNLLQLDISQNPLKTLANGVLYGVPKSAGTMVSVDDTPIELIQGCLFNDV